MRRRSSWLWWTALLLLWLLATAADRLWLGADQHLPAWDQADYLNSAVDHGRALGLLAGGRWQGWQALLDLSPKIPPLASLVGGSVMALAGESADQASWVLSLWNGLLLLVIALWGRQLLTPGFGLLAAALTALAPALMALRVDYTLDIPLSACCALALWRLWLWQRPDPEGGRWLQAISAAITLAAALLVKQSALLVLAPPALWCLVQAQRASQRRLQSWTALALVLGLLLPWLHHNWITTLGGTERAVVQSGAEEGDPGPLDPRSLLWYPRLWPDQLGAIPLTVGLSGLALLGWQHGLRRDRLFGPGWPWLLGCCVSGWLCTSLSPNKDPRYIAPLLALLALLLARGWWAIGAWLQRHLGPIAAGVLLAAGLVSSGVPAAAAARARLQLQPSSGVSEAMTELRRRVGTAPTTLLIAASSPDLNEQTLTLLGRSRGGQILVRRLGRDPGDEALALQQGEWWLLASGDQGTSRESAREMSRLVRRDGRFQLLRTWPWSEQRQLELWQRRPEAAAPGSFDQAFISMARGIEAGPKGLATVFDSIGRWHLLDPRFSYQPRVQQWSAQRLRQDPNDRDALWSLALLAVLQNRPAQADHWFSRLEQLEGRGSWASAYRTVVLVADWNGCRAAQVSDVPTSVPDHGDGRPQLLTALRDLSRSLCLDPRGPWQLRTSLPAAVQQVTNDLKSP